MLFIPFLISTTQIEPQTSAENFLPEDHPFQRFFTAQNAFISSREDETVEMQVTPAMALLACMIAPCCA